MKNYKYSIIIPHLNEGYFLDITLDSIYNYFKYDNYEIIIVDDGSKDIRDLNFVKKHLLKDKIKIYFEKNLGLSKAKNFGAKKSSGDYLIFLDSHMYFRNDFLGILNSVLNNYTEVDLLQPVVGNIRNKSVAGSIYKIKDFFLNSTWDRLENDSKKNMFETPNISGGATIVKKEAFDKMDGFHNFFIKWGCEDLEFSMRAWLYGYKCFLNTNLFVAHYFKESFKNTKIEPDNVCNNRIMFAITCFENKDRLKNIFSEIEEYYGKDIYKTVYDKILNNKDFRSYVENQKGNYKFDDDGYFEKFKNYLPK